MKPPRPHPTNEVTEEVVIPKAARAQEEARSRASAGDVDGAQRLLRKTAKSLRAVAPSSERAAELEEQASRMEEHLQAMADGSFDPLTSKKMRYQSREAQRKRRPE